MRLIDADALLDEFTEDCPQIPNDKVDVHAIGMYHQYQHDTYKIVNAPTVDAVEQKHGHWIYDYESNKFDCSICGLSMVRNSYVFCPWCGANMNEEVKIL